MTLIKEFPSRSVARKKSFWLNSICSSVALIFIPPLIGTYLFASAMMKTLMGLDSSAPELQTSPVSIALSMLLTTVIPTLAVVVLLISLIRYLALPKEV